MIDVLRRRLLAELFGDSDGVAATLAPGFEVVMHTGSASVTLTADVVTDSVRAQAAAGILSWTEFDDVVVGAEVLAASGSLCTVQIAEMVLTTMPLAVFIRFDENLMSSEVAFISGLSASTSITSDEVPSLEHLRRRLRPT